MAVLSRITRHNREGKLMLLLITLDSAVEHRFSVVPHPPWQGAYVHHDSLGSLAQFDFKLTLFHPDIINTVGK